MQDKETLLLIDDEEAILIVTRMMLEGIGYSVLTASKGRKGIDIFQENSDRINTVLTDLIMPDMNGLEALKEMKKIRSNVKVILVSGYNEQDIIQRFGDAGFSGFIQKPYSMEDLLKTISSI